MFLHDRRSKESVCLLTTPMTHALQSKPNTVPAHARSNLNSFRRGSEACLVRRVVSPVKPSGIQGNRPMPLFKA
jgi:hypothetical protein